MTIADDAKNMDADTAEHVRIYNGIMKNYAQVAIPLAMALTMFFVQLTMRSGLVPAIVWFVVVYAFVLFVVKTFFSH